MSRGSSDILSFGVFILILAASIAAYAAGILLSVFEAFSLVMALFGVWIMALAGMRGGKEEKYVRGAFSVFSWGAIITAFGTVLFLYFRGLPPLYLLSALLLILGLLVLAAALRTRQK